MHTVRTDDGTRYRLLKRSSDSSLVRDLSTGDEHYIENASLEFIDDAPFETVADAIPESDRALELLLVLDRRGPTAVLDLMALTDLCESDFNGLFSELRAAGLIEPIEIGGVPGYETTDRASAELSALEESERE